MYKKINWMLADAGYVVKDPVSIVVDSLQSATNLQLLTKENVMEYGETINYNYETLSQNIVNNSITYANDNLTYYIYDFINIIDFFSYYSFSKYASVSTTLNSYKTALTNLCSNSDNVYFLSNKSGSSFAYLYDTTLLSVPRSFFDENYLVLASGSFTNLHTYNFQSFRIPRDGSSVPSDSSLGNASLRFYDGLSFIDSSDGFTFYNSFSKNGGNDFDRFEQVLGIPTYWIRQGLINNDNGWFSNASFSGTSFIYSGESFSIPVFKATNLVNDFISGNAPVYKFDKTVDLGQFGEDIDYSKLYDLISSTVQGNTGNVIDSINNVANNYLQQQLDLLHDINNALNDGNGQSWLRRIYGILDYNFPLTLNAFQELIDAVQNISVSGGGGDFSEATQVLHDIDTKLGILIDEPFTDLTDEDWNSMKSRVQTKFPFCIFSDIVAISVILNRPPQQPDLNFPVPIMGTESDNMVHIDLSPYEHARPYVHGVLIFVFIIGLLALSVKIFDHLKS